MGNGYFVFTPELLVPIVMIKYPKAENGGPFRYLDEETDRLQYSPIPSERKEEAFAPEAFPHKVGICCPAGNSG